MSFLVDFEILCIDVLLKFFLDCVVFYGEVILDKLFQNFFQSEFIDLAIRDQPPNLDPNLLEDPLPVYHVLKLVLCARLSLWNFLHLQVVLKVFNVGDQKRL